jgi:hypothetical protein
MRQSDRDYAKDRRVPVRAEKLSTRDARRSKANNVSQFYRN